MNIEMVKEDKNEIELKIDNVTVAEILRIYLNEQGVEFAAWRREHPSRPVFMKIKSSGNIRKVVNDSVNAIKKECDALVSGLKK
jgi:DNA-directed RNA polymerase subunit L